MKLVESEIHQPNEYPEIDEMLDLLSSGILSRALEGARERGARGFPLSEDDRKVLEALVTASKAVTMRFDIDILDQDLPTPDTFLPRTPYPIAPDKILFVIKKTKVEMDTELLRLSTLSLRDHYEHTGSDADTIFESHENQKRSIRVLKDAFPEARFITFDELTPSLIESSDLIAAVGGDNHFQFVAQRVTGLCPIVGINSDYPRSVGAILSADADEAVELRKTITEGTYRFAPKTRLQVFVNGRELPPSLSEVYIGEEKRRDMSRNVVSIASAEDGSISHAVQQKSSGILVATGSGSTGWFRSSAEILFPGGAQFNGEMPIARFCGTERYRSPRNPDGVGERLAHKGSLKFGDILTLRSLNDAHGIVLVDCNEREGAECPPGTLVIIQIAPDPLWTIQFAR